MNAASQIAQARAIVEVLRALIAKAASYPVRPEDEQVVTYDLASVSSAVAAAAELVECGERGVGEPDLALAFAADVAADLLGRLAGREAIWGIDAAGLMHGLDAEIAAGRDPRLLERIGERVSATGEAGSRDIPEDLELVRRTFRKFAEERVVPIAERVHRNDEDIPAAIISDLSAMGCFGLSIPAEYGGFAEGGRDDLLNMVLVTEELSRGSLGVAGSLITRPEIIGTAIVRGGTETQKQRWLPLIATGEKLCGVAVTEPDHGSDVAAIKTSAVRDGDGWVLSGVKTWCTFAGQANYLLVLARTDPDRSAGHRGLSLFVVEKPSFAGHSWRITQDGGGSIEGRAIATIGYRGMHSFEVNIDRWRLPAQCLIGEEHGLGRGFYLQMQAFANARLQTAARAVGVMQAALEQAVAYSQQRSVFGRPLAHYQLTRAKIARMAVLVAACRAFSYSAARAVTAHGGQLEAAQVKQLACRSAEWVTREAQQLHGGYGYAEEFAISRLFVDSRVLSIFEGADEILALRVIARQLVTA